MHGILISLFFLGTSPLFAAFDWGKKIEEYQVPGISIAVVNEGKIALAKGYGRISFDQTSPPVDIHTLFQAASISKPLTAFGALILVQQGKVALDDDVNLFLKRWQVSEKVTLRQLLSHTAGTSVSGFSGYEVNAQIPNIVDILKGQPPLVNSYLQGYAYKDTGIVIMMNNDAAWPLMEEILSNETLIR
jgi:CubicO group peptidase (beta-lactamase class C family)